MDVPAIAAHFPTTMATTEEDLVQLEKDVRQVKIEYEVFFGGGRKRPPTDLEWRIDQTIKRYTERGPKLTAPQMFRLNGFIQRYVKFRGDFSKAIEAARRRNRSAAFWSGGEGSRIAAAAASGRSKACAECGSEGFDRGAYRPGAGIDEDEEIVRSFPRDKRESWREYEQTDAGRFPRIRDAEIERAARREWRVECGVCDRD